MAVHKKKPVGLSDRALELVMRDVLAIVRDISHQTHPTRNAAKKGSIRTAAPKSDTISRCRTSGAVETRKLKTAQKLNS